MIVKAEVTSLISTRVSVFRCTVCNAEFEHEREAAVHENTHENLRYENPKGYGAVYVTEKAVNHCEINHKIFGRKNIEWKGEGWYVMHEYTVQYHGCDPEIRCEFIALDVAISNMKEKFYEMSQDWRYYHAVRKAGKPQ